MALTTLLLSVVAISLALGFLKPGAKVKEIPSIPFFTSLYHMCGGVGKTTFYEDHLRQPLEKYGAVNVWNSGRWTVLITNPEYLTQVFRNEHVFAKGGFFKKVPWGTFARLFGENIIDSHGDLWKHFGAIVRPGIQRPYSIDSMRRISSKLASMFLVQQESVGSEVGISVDSFVQRWAVTVYGDYFLDHEFECLSNPNTGLQKVLDQFKKGVLSPLVSGFPVLERFHWLLPSVRRSFSLIDELELQLVTAVDGKKSSIEKEKAPNEKLIHLLRQARSEGRLSEFHYLSHFKTLFVAGHENVHLVLVSLLWELAANPDVQIHLRQEVLDHLPLDYSVEDINSLPYLAAVIYEVLRLYPPISQLTNRVALEPFCLGENVNIPAGTWVGWSAYGVHTDTRVWGSAAREFRPDRWGSDIHTINRKFRLDQSRGAYIPFNAHSRRCLGSGFALVELKVALCELVLGLQWDKDPGYEFSITSVSIS
jgi:unspecific monooxygenase